MSCKIDFPLFLINRPKSLASKVSSAFLMVTKQQRPDRILFRQAVHAALFRDALHRHHMENNTTTDYVGGRLERRTCYVTNQLTYVDEAQYWKHSKSVFGICF